MKDFNFEIFRTNVQAIRYSQGLSGEDLSKNAGLRNRKRIADIERGHGTPDLGEVVKICSTLNVSIDNMLYKPVTVIYQWGEQLRSSRTGEGKEGGKDAD